MASSRLKMMLDSGFQLNFSLKPDLKDLVEHVTPQYAIHWKEIGIQIGVPVGEIQAIELGHPTMPKVCCNEMFTKWLECDVDASWDKVFTAIDSTAIDSPAVSKPSSVITDVDEFCSVQDHFCGLYKYTRCTDSENDWPMFRPKQYVSLALIHYKGEPTRREVIAINKANRAGKIDQIFDQETCSGTDSVHLKSPSIKNELSHERYVTTKDLSDIFAPVESIEIGETSSPMILIEGAPGVGKTVLSIEIAYQWAIGKLLRNVKLVFHLKLRDPAVHRMKSVKEMLLYFYKHDDSSLEMCKSCASSLVRSSGDRVAIIFDGYDELPKSCRDDSFIAHIIDHKVLPKCTKVITSRPIASAELHSKVSCRVEILGFTTADRNDYIKYALHDLPDQIELLKSYLREHPNIDSLCYIPLNMTILLCLFKEQQQLPSSQTDLYEKFILLTILHHLKKVGVSLCAINRLKHLPKEYASIVNKLSLLAYQYLKDDKIVFQYSDIDSICPNIGTVPGALNGFGLLQAVQLYSFSQTKQEMSFNFFHYSVQEFLAAFYIANLNAFQQGAILKETFWIGKYFNVWIMYVGLTEGGSMAFKHFLSGNKSLLFSWMSRTKKMSVQLLQDKVKCFHLFQLAQEANNELLCNRFGDIFDQNTIDFSHVELTQNHMQILGYVIAKCNKMHWTKLSLTNANISDVELQLFCQAVMLADSSHAVHIETIDLNHNLLSEACIKSLVDIVKHFNTTKLIISNNCFITGFGILISSTAVKELDASHNCIGLSETQQLAEAIKQNIYLEKLNISNSACDGRELAKIVHSIALYNETLKHFDITGCEVSEDDAYVYAITIYTFNTVLTVFQYDSCNLLLESLNYLRYTSFTMLHSIQDNSFRLNHGHFLPKDIIVLSKVLTSSCIEYKLSTLRLCDSLKTDTGCTLFFSTLTLRCMDTNCKLHISHIDLSNNNLTPSCIDAVVVTVQLCNTTMLCIGYNVLRNSVVNLIGETALVELNISSNELNNDIADHFSFSKVPSLKILNVSHNSLGTGVATVVTNTCLVELDLSHNNLELNAIYFLAEALKYCRSIISLNLSNNNINEDAAILLADALNINTKLVKLNVSCNLLNEGVAALISNTHLVELDVSHNKMESTSVAMCFKLLRKNSSLKKFSLQNVNVDDIGTDEFTWALAINTTLNEIDISGCCMSPNRVQRIAVMSKIINSTLTALMYNCNNILADQTCDISSEYDLCNFNFSNKNLFPEGAIILGTLITNSEATIFDISGNSIGDLGCEFIIKKLLACKVHLSSVNLSVNGLTSSCIQSVISLVQHCKTTFLKISYNSLMDAVATLIKDTTLVELHASYDTVPCSEEILDNIIKAVNDCNSLKKLYICGCGIKSFLTTNTSVIVEYS